MATPALQQSAEQEMDRSYYLDAVNKASERTRGTVYILVLAILIIFCESRFAVMPGWMTVRVHALEKARACWDAPVQDDKCVAAKSYVMGMYLPDSLKAGTTGVQPDERTVDPIISSALAEARKLVIDQRVEEVPLLGIKFDSLDAPLWGSIGLSFVLLVLLLTITRERTNIQLAINRGVPQGLLNSGQIFSTSKFRGFTVLLVWAAVYTDLVMLWNSRDAVADRYLFVSGGALWLVQDVTICLLCFVLIVGLAVYITREWNRLSNVIRVPKPAGAPDESVIVDAHRAADASYALDDRQHAVVKSAPNSGVASPRLEMLRPAAGPAGSRVTVIGTGFGASVENRQVTLDSLVLPAELIDPSSSDTEMAFIVPFQNLERNPWTQGQTIEIGVLADWQPGGNTLPFIIKDAQTVKLVSQGNAPVQVVVGKPT